MNLVCRYVLVIIITLNSSFLAKANNSCSEHLSAVQKNTINYGLAAGLVQISENNIGDLKPNEAQEIQRIVDLLGFEVFILGSAAKGKRRFIGTDLPLSIFGKSKKGTRSDIDYAVKKGLGDLTNNFQFPDIDSMWGVREIEFVNLSNSPAIIFRPSLKPIYIYGSGRFYLD